MTQKLVSILNGSPEGDRGNCGALSAALERRLTPRVAVQTIALAERMPSREELVTSSGFLFMTGTYWDSWGSPLQRFFEAATSWEGGDVWFGKPAGAVVLMQSVGGKSVLSRLLGVLNTLGASIPPMGGMVYSLANQLALTTPRSWQTEDLWCPADLAVVCHNLAEATLGGRSWRAWPVEGTKFRERWLELEKQ